MSISRLVAGILVTLSVLGCNREAAPGGGGAQGEAKLTLRMGHFSNITHAQGLVAHALSRQGKGWFEERLGPGVKIEWYVYRAGPSAMEAIFAGSLDATYVGPNPALNAYIKSKGEEIRIIAGSTRGGAALVVQGDGRIKTAADFRPVGDRRRRVATPQLGNTQDVACRAWLIDQGLHVTQLGGDVNVIPTANPDQLSLFQKGDLDAVWTVEPWVSRLEMEAGGKIFLEEKDALTTILVASAALVSKHPELVQKILRAHEELTAWIKANPAEAQRLVLEELKAETKRDMPADLVARAWSRLELTSTLDRAALEKFLAAARRVGFLADTIDLSRMVGKP